jgi:hypothetical protein
VGFAENIIIGAVTAISAMLWRLHDYPDTGPKTMLIGTIFVTASVLAIVNFVGP